MIWTDSFLNGLVTAAERQIAIDVPCLFYRFCLGTTAGLSVYTLPSFVKGVKRITWLGRKVEPLNWDQFVLLTPATVWVNTVEKIETAVSRPQWYTMHPTNILDIRFFPTPDLTLSPTAEDPYSPDVGMACIVSCWRYVDITIPQASLPPYIDRHLRKAYVLWKAFEQEGPGQNMKAAQYYKGLYNFLIEQFRLINDGCFVSKKYSLGDGLFGLENYRYPKPIYPPNFERLLF